MGSDFAIPFFMTRNTVLSLTSREMDSSTLFGEMSGD